MTARERILALRLCEKAREDPAFMRRIGVQCRQRTLHTEVGTAVSGGSCADTGTAEEENYEDD